MNYVEKCNKSKQIIPPFLSLQTNNTRSLCKSEPTTPGQILCTWHKAQLTIVQMLSQWCGGLGEGGLCKLFNLLKFSVVKSSEAGFPTKRDVFTNRVAMDSKTTRFDGDTRSVWEPCYNTLFTYWQQMYLIEQAGMWKENINGRWRAIHLFHLSPFPMLCLLTSVYGIRCFLGIIHGFPNEIFLWLAFSLLCLFVHV